MSPMREKDRNLRRRRTRRRKLRKLKKKLRETKDLRRRQDLIARIRKYQPFFGEG
ncbi:MAG: hypothetical protein PVF70_05110 [Anaerolineales bacterium]|jgi:hypothetical protein